MYEFSTSEERAAFIDAIDNGATQRIRGILHLVTHDIALEENAIVGTPHIDQKCVESDDNFMFGQLYVGTLDIILDLPSVSSAPSFRAAQISLEFGVDIDNDDPIYIPLGIWDISSADRQIGEKRWKIKGVDRLNRLRTAINDDTVGRIPLSAILSTISRETNVQFAQTVDQIAAMIGRPANRITCVEFADTCFEEVRQIAQIMGGFAFANREGKIEFRRFGMQPVLENSITADKRFNFKLSDYSYGVDSITYVDSKKHSYTASTGTIGGTVNLTFFNNKYIYTGTDDYEEYFAEWIDPIAENFTQSWYTGTCDYYGDPALDLGDMIAVTGGLADESTLPMLITGISWGFRAPQTLTSAGLPDTGAGASSYSTGGSSGGSSSQTAVTAVLRTVPLETFPDDFEGRYTAALGGFAARQPVDAFVNIGIVVTANTDGIVSAKVLLDEIAQVLQPAVSVQNGDTVTLSAMVPISPDEGTHTVRVEVSGSGTITDISAVVVGQDIAPESPDITTESDYTYTIANGAATITGYIGTALRPRIPDVLGGAPVRTIAKGAFTGTAVISVTIPEGVAHIE